MTALSILIEEGSSVLNVRLNLYIFAFKKLFENHLKTRCWRSVIYKTY